MQPDCLKGRVEFGTVYGDIHLEDLLGLIARVGTVLYPGSRFLSSATWPLMPEKPQNGIILIVKC